MCPLRGKEKRTDTVQPETVRLALDVPLVLELGDDIGIWFRALKMNVGFRGFEADPHHTSSIDVLGSSDWVHTLLTQAELGVGQCHPGECDGIGDEGAVGYGLIEEFDTEGSAKDSAG